MTSRRFVVVVTAAIVAAAIAPAARSRVAVAQAASKGFPISIAVEEGRMIGMQQSREEAVAQASRIARTDAIAMPRSIGRFVAGR